MDSIIISLNINKENYSKEDNGASLKMNPSVVAVFQLLRLDSERILSEMPKIQELILKISLNENRLINQNANFPIIQLAIRKLRESFEDSDLDNDLTLQKIENQLLNLVELSNLLNEIDDKVALEKLQNFEFSYTKNEDKKWIEIVDPDSVVIEESFLTGHTHFAESEKADLRKKVLTHITKLNGNTNLFAHKKQPQSQVREVDLKDFIAFQNETVIPAKAWAKNEEYLFRIGRSSNYVFQLGDIGFFKIPKDMDPLTGMMEVFVSDLSVLMGLKDFFVQTRIIAIEAKGACEFINDSFNNSFENLDINFPAKGTLQPKQNGWVLSSYMNYKYKKPAINMDEIFKATLVAGLLGMWDAHSENIFITEEGKIKFIDNCRSLPNGNGWIKHGASYVPTFRLGLLNLDKMYDPISLEDRKKMIEMIRQFQEKMNDVRNYFYSPGIKLITQKLPPGWLDVDSMLQATDNRLAFMLESLENPNCLTLNDMIMNSIPGYRHAFAINMAEYLGRNYSRFKSYFNESKNNTTALECIQRDSGVHNNLGFECNVRLINSLIRHNIDPQFIQGLADTSNLSTSEITNKLIHYMEANYKAPGKILTPEEKAKEAENRSLVYQNGDNYKKSIINQATIDYKDISREDCEKLWTLDKS